MTQRSIFQLVQAENNRHCENKTMDINNHSTNTNQTEEKASNTGEKSITIAMFVCLGIIGCLGNGFVLFIFCSSEKLRQSIVNIYLINQSAIDLMASLMLIVTAKGVTKSAHWIEDRIQGKLYFSPLTCGQISCSFVFFQLSYCHFFHRHTKLAVLDIR